MFRLRSTYGRRRQPLTFIEVAMDIACNAHELHEMRCDGDLDPIRIVATPMSLLLDKLGRDHWRDHWRDDREWDRHRKALAAQRAEAQRLWEEDAAREAEAWRKRVEGEGSEEEGEGQGRGQFDHGRKDENEDEGDGEEPRP
jgi:hypothetical protein